MALICDIVRISQAVLQKIYKYEIYISKTQYKKWWLWTSQGKIIWIPLHLPSRKLFLLFCATKIIRVFMTLIQFLLQLIVNCVSISSVVFFQIVHYFYLFSTRMARQSQKEKKLWWSNVLYEFIPSTKPY